MPSTCRAGNAGGIHCSSRMNGLWEYYLVEGNETSQVTKVSENHVVNECYPLLVLENWGMGAELE